MARPLRIEYDGAVYHVTSRGNARKAIFRDDGDREMFLSVLQRVNKKYNWICHAYCLMNNHYHQKIGRPGGTYISTLFRIATEIFFSRTSP
jgi:putative transposase